MERKFRIKRFDLTHPTLTIYQNRRVSTRSSQSKIRKSKYRFPSKSKLTISEDIRSSEKPTFGKFHSEITMQRPSHQVHHQVTLFNKLPTNIRDSLSFRMLSTSRLTKISHATAFNAVRGFTSTNVAQSKNLFILNILRLDS